MLAEVLALTAAQKLRSKLVGNHGPKHVQITDFDPSDLEIAVGRVVRPGCWGRKKF
jgi:hypothetical protein